MKIWVTKYALTSGIAEYDGVQINGNMATVPGHEDEKGRTVYSQHFHGRDWHSNLDDALARAEEMRDMKIASLNKSIAKLSKMKFGG